MNSPVEKDEQLKPEYTFDLSTIESANISELHQEGNYLVATTNTGVRFRQRIPQGKILTKRNDEYVLEDIQVREFAK